MLAQNGLRDVRSMKDGHEIGDTHHLPNCSKAQIKILK